MALGGGERVGEHRWKVRKGSVASIWAEDGQRGVLHGDLGAAAVCSGAAGLRWARASGGGVGEL